MLHINELTYRLGPRILFDRATAAIPTGARTGFVGRNGTGKTTLFRMIAGDLHPEAGTLQIPNRTRLGQVEQEAPGGPQSLVDFVLAADRERASLLAEAETATDPHRIAEIHTRLVDIDAHAAPSRAAVILQGLGFDEPAQSRALSEFSGGWRMRVALAAVLFTRPDLLLLDEPTNYLDLEGTLWLIDYLATYPATVLVISHDRDLLDAVCDHILHLDQAKLSVWKGNYDSFERQRREQQAIQAKHIRKQEEQRRHLQSFVDRFRASATKARQAQSRIKMLERLQPISAIVDSDVLPFTLPSPQKPLSPPIVAMDGVSCGYRDRTVLSRLGLNISNDDRIGLLGSNGNGKSTFAKLVAGRMDPMAGSLKRSSKMTVGFFAQHQAEELDAADTPYRLVSARMPGAPESRIRTRAAGLGFPAQRADTPVAQLSGGEKARLMMGLAAFDGPHLLILDEPTNHLDIDSRAALIEAINDYEGAIILIAHDRYLIDACADRLWLVDGGTVKSFEGDMDDYKSLVLSRAGGGAAPKKAEAALAKPLAQDNRMSPAKAAQLLKRQVGTLDERIKKLSGLIARVDAALTDPNAYSRDKNKAGQLAQQRKELARALETAEDEWLALTTQLEATG